jgi:hypothetical protein
MKLLNKILFICFLPLLGFGFLVAFLALALAFKVGAFIQEIYFAASRL